MLTARQSVQASAMATLPPTVVPRGDQDWEILVPLDALSAWMDSQGFPAGKIENPARLGATDEISQGKSDGCGVCLGTCNSDRLFQ